MRTVERDMVLMRGLERKLQSAGGQDSTLAGEATSKRKQRQQKKNLQAGQLPGTARREDLVNLWDSVVQNYTETKNLPFVQSDAALLTIVAANLAMARANKWVNS